MASSKKTRKRSTNSRQQKKPSVKDRSFLKNEIIILVSLALCIFLEVSYFGDGGLFGKTVAPFMFGVFGIFAYIVPILLFLGIAFCLLNKGNRQLYINVGCISTLYLMISTLLQMIMHRDYIKKPIADIYEICSSKRNGGGVIGGIVSNLLCSAIGEIPTYVVVIIICIIAIVILTGKSFVSAVKNEGEKVYHSAKDDMIRRKEESEKKRAEQSVNEKPQKRMDKVVSGVSFNTTLEKEAPKPVADIEELFEPKQTDEIVINRATPISEDEEDFEPSVKEETGRKRRSTKESRENAAKEATNVEQEIKKQDEKPKKAYKFPPMSLLTKGSVARGDSDLQLRETTKKLEQTLQNFNVNVTVTNVSCGPSVTRYELQPEMGVKVSKIVGLADDIKLNLAASDIRIEAPIPGKAAVGIEVPNQTKVAVRLRDVLETAEFREHKSKLASAIGKDIGGNVIVADIAKMPHVLIAGTTGSGKSVCVNSIIMSILYKASPDEVKFIMIDPKQVEMKVYNGIPHLLVPVVTDPKKAAGALNWAVAEMTRRYQLFSEYNVRDLKGYNERVEAIKDIEADNKPERMPQIVIVVDEFADLMMVAPGEVEDAVCRLAQLARACGIHLVLATQRPSVNVITGLIKANMPSRIALTVSSGVDSRTIIDMNGAEKLLGNGDMLFYPAGYSKPARVQGTYVSDDEVQSVVDFLINNGNGVEYNEEITNHINSVQNGSSGGGVSSNSDDRDAYFVEAGRFVIEKDKASIGMLQRVFKIGFNRAARIMDQLADAGVVGEEEGTKPRKILMTIEEFEQYIDEYV